MPGSVTPQPEAGQQAEGRRHRGAQSAGVSDDDDDERGKRARKMAAANAVSKAVKGLVGGVAMGSAETRERWASKLIPRSTVVGSPCTTAPEQNDAKKCAWGAGDARKAQAEMRQAGSRGDGPPNIP